MAQNATSYKVELSVCDMDRHYYETHKLTVAKHPSETDERLMVRVLAFALNAHEGTVRQNELETRLKGGEVQAKSKPKSRMGKAIASVPKPNAPPTSTSSSPTEPSSTNTSGMPTAMSTSTSQADFERLKPQGSQSPVGVS